MNTGKRVVVGCGAMSLDVVGWRDHQVLTAVRSVVEGCEDALL